MSQIFNLVGGRRGIAAHEVVAPPRRTDQYDSSSLLLVVSRAPRARGALLEQSIPSRGRRSSSCSSARNAVLGFTLIEVIGALVIFSVGVLMIIQVSGALGIRMRYAGARSEIVVFANERLDSLGAEVFTALSAGTSTRTLTAEGIGFTCTTTISVVTPVLKRIDVSIAPTSGGDGPTHTVTSYASAVW